MRFTVDGSEALESRIARDLDGVREAALSAVGAENLSALILGGGYGRGEGGVYVVDGEERVYNDYDFFVVVPYSSRKRRKWLAEQLLAVKAAVEPDCGIHVDFGPPMPCMDLPKQPYELMFMELKAGHHVVHGPKDILAALPDYDQAHPPLEEGARLFMNRGIGLLMADMLLREDRALRQDEHEFVIRNMYKALMALGDGILFIMGNYDPSYAIRRERIRAATLTGVPESEKLKAAYEGALEFKFRPSHDLPDGQSLQQWYDETAVLFDAVFLWYEQQRLALPDLNWAAYEALSTRLPILRPKSPMKNVYRNLRTTAGMLPSFGECFLHPRDRILKRLPALLSRVGKKEDEALVLRLWESFG